MFELYQQGQVPFSLSLTAALRQEVHQGLISRWLVETLSSPPTHREAVDLLISIKKKSLRKRLMELQQQIMHYEHHKRGSSIADGVPGAEKGFGAYWRKS